MIKKMEADWAGRTVSLQEGNLSEWEFPDGYFPWLAVTDRGMEVVVPDSTYCVSEGYKYVHVGVKFDDLIEGLIRDAADSPDDLWEAIAALERAIQTLKTEPLRTEHD